MRPEAGGGGLRRPGAGLVVVCAAQFLIGVDELAVVVALPTLQRDLALKTGQAQWVLTAFGLGFGGLLLLGGRVGALYGCRRLLVAGLGLFETANHLGGDAAAVALYATVIALVAGHGPADPETLARGYGAAFLAAAGLAGLGALGALQLRRRP